MTDFDSLKISTGRRRGDSYELHLLAVNCLRMLVESKILAVIHEYRPALPADDVIVETSEGLECYQAKHTADPHAFIQFKDLVEDTNLGLDIQRLRTAWESLSSRGKEVRLHLYTNRAADPELAKILNGDHIAASVVENFYQKRLREQLKARSGIIDDDTFKVFLSSLRFDVRQPDLRQIQEQIKKDWLEHRLGLNPEEAYPRLMYNVEQWWLEGCSRPIIRGEVLQALQIDASTLPQVFHVNPQTYIADNAFERRVDELLAQVEEGYVALIGPPGSGKSTFISRYLSKPSCQHAIRYFCFTEVNDPFFRRRASEKEFLKSMIEQLRSQFGELLPKEGRYDYSSEHFYSLISHLGSYFSARGERLLMVVDGLDHVKRTNIEESQKLLNVLPERLPKGVICLIGAQGIEYLPPSIERECRKGRSFNKPLFDLPQTVRYLRCYPELRNQLVQRHFQLIHTRSEGLPLYLRYIAEQLSKMPSADFDGVIASLPPHDGHIDQYYGQLWNECSSQASLRHLCGLVARLRFRIQQTDLLEIVGADAFEGQQLINRIRHLLEIRETGCRIFHNSFRHFIQSELTKEERFQLDKEILAYLNRKRGTPAWFEHAFKYAMAAQDYTFLTGTVDAAYVEDAIAKGRPRDEILEVLRLGVEAAVELTSPIATARISTLVSHTANRLEHHIDHRQLQRTLFALGEPTAALSAISYDGKVYDCSRSTAEALIDLASEGHEDVARALARSFFDQLPKRLDNVEEIISASEVSAVFARFPAEWLSDNVRDLQDHTGIGTLRESSGVRLLRLVLQRLYQFRRYSVIRAVRRLLLESSDGPRWSQQWFFETAILESEYRPKTAEHHLRYAAQQVKDKRMRILLAGAAARTGCSKELANTLLGDLTVLPPLRNETIRFFEATDDFKEFRAYVAVLTYCERDPELNTLREYFGGGDTWLATYYLANLEMVIVLIRLACGRVIDPQEILRPLERLNHHRSHEGERIFEVFSAIRKDLPDFLEAVIDGYVAFKGKSEQLLQGLRGWAASELVNTHYGIDFAGAEFNSELAALAKAANHTGLCSDLKPHMIALHDKICSETVETGTRADHLLKVAEIAARCGDKTLAQEWLREGLQASNGYGSHKDITLDLLIDAMTVANEVDRDNALSRIADIADWNGWMHRITDGRETKWFAKRLFEAVIKYDFDVALRLLLSYRDNVARWKFYDCLKELLEAYKGHDEQLAYVLSEVINECTYEKGFENKFEARHHLLRLAIEHGDSANALWIAKRLVQFLQCEVPPNQRQVLANAYNETAARNGLPTVPVISSTPQSSALETKPETSQEVVKIGEESLPVTNLVRRMSESVDTFLRISTELKAGSHFYTYREHVNEATINLITQAATPAQLDRIEEAIAEDSLSGADKHEALARAYQRLGASERHLSQLRAAFESFHGWGLWDKRIEYLIPLIANNKDEALKFLLKVIEGSVKRNDYGGFGSAILLVRALREFGDSSRDWILKIYDELHRFVGSQFVNLPKSDDAASAWLRTQPLDLRDFEGIAFDIILDEWKDPAFHRRIALTHLLRDLTLVQPNRCLPRLVAALDQEDRTLREQSALVLCAVAMEQPGLLQSYVEDLSKALHHTHFEVTQHLVSALRQIRSLAELPVDVASRLNILYPSIRSSELVLPPQGLRPSEEFYRRVLMRSMRSLVDMVRDSCRLLELDVDALYWRIEQQLSAIGYDEQEAEDEHRSRWTYHRHPQGEPIILFETYASHFLRHSFMEIIDRLARDGSFPSEMLEAVHRRVRLYDPSFPWRHTKGKPVDLALPPFEDPHGGEKITPEVDEWLNFNNVATLKRTSLRLPWISIFDYYFQTQGRLKESCISVSHLVSRSLADSISSGSSDPGNGDPVLAIGHKPPLFTITIGEAQSLLDASTFTEDPIRASRIPLIAIHNGDWWYLKRYDLAGLAGPWIQRYSLTWRSSDSLDMLSGGKNVLQHIHWQDGYLTSDYQHESVGVGTRLCISNDLLKSILSEFDLQLLITKHVIRKFKKPSYGQGEVDREQERDIFEIVEIA